MPFPDRGGRATAWRTRRAKKQLSANGAGPTIAIEACLGQVPRPVDAEQVQSCQLLRLEWTADTDLIHERRSVGTRVDAQRQQQHIVGAHGVAHMVQDAGRLGEVVQRPARQHDESNGPAPSRCGSFPAVRTWTRSGPVKSPRRSSKLSAWSGKSE